MIKGGSRLLRTKNDTIFFFQRHIVLTDENMTAVTTTMSRETTTAGVGNLNDDRRAYGPTTGQPHIEIVFVFKDRSTIRTAKNFYKL